MSNHTPEISTSATPVSGCAPSSSSSSFVLFSDDEDVVQSSTTISRDNQKKTDSKHQDTEEDEQEDVEEEEEEEEEEQDDDDDDDHDDDDDDDEDNQYLSETSSDADYDHFSTGLGEDSDEDDLLSLDGSEEAAPDSPGLPLIPPPPTATRRRARRNNEVIRQIFPCTLPTNITLAIFAYLDHETLHSCLTVNKGWFQFAAGRLYRDPFRTDENNEGTNRETRLRPLQEQSLVRLLLRSICCPSEPGEETVIAVEQVQMGDDDDMTGLCRLVDRNGDEIRTTVNYMRFLEVFDWAPWQRYLDYWGPIQSEVRDMAAALANSSIGKNTSETCSTGHHPAAAVHNVAEHSYFRFSSHTILDWFVENPNPHTLVLHPDMDLPHQIARLMPRWKTLRFNGTPPPSFFTSSLWETELVNAEPKRSKDYFTNFNSCGLLQALLECEIKDSTAIKSDKNSSGIRHFQFPPPFYYNSAGEYDSEIATMMQAIRRPHSLDASACDTFGLQSFDVPDANLRHLVRFVCMGVHDSLASFLRRCPNLREVEMLVTRADEIHSLGPALTTRPRRPLVGSDLFYSAESKHPVEDLKWHDKPDSLARKAGWSQGLAVARLYAGDVRDLPVILQSVRAKLFHSLRELKLDLAPPGLRSHTPLDWDFFQVYISKDTFAMPLLEELYLRLTLHINLETEDPFGGCPRLRRLTLVSDVRFQAWGSWRVPRSVRELVLDGPLVKKKFKTECLGQLSRLESLAFLDDDKSSSTSTAWSSPWLEHWPPRNFLVHLKTLRLSGTAAHSFKFEWMVFFPILEVLEVDGLNYRNILKACMDTEDEQSSSALPNLPLRHGGLRVCKFTVVNGDLAQITCEETVDYFHHLTQKWSSPQMEEETNYITVAEATIERMLSGEDTSEEASDGDEKENQNETKNTAASEPTLDRYLLAALARFCPDVQRLAIHFAPYLILSTFVPVELQLGTLAKLKHLLPKLTRFDTKSFALNGDKLRQLADYGFCSRSHCIHGKGRWEDCVFHFGEAEYLLSAGK